MISVIAIGVDTAENGQLKSWGGSVIGVGGVMNNDDLRAQTQQVAVQALQLGVQAQKDMNKQINIDKIDQLIEDMQEQQDIQNEVTQVHLLS